MSCEEEVVRKEVLWPAAEGKDLWAKATGVVGRGRIDCKDAALVRQRQDLAGSKEREPAPCDSPASVCCHWYCKRNLRNKIPFEAE